MSDFEAVTVSAELQPEIAEQEIARAVSARHKIARRYVMRLRKRNPEASPAEIIALLERHYVTAITVAGGVVTAGTIAANVGMALIPGVAASKEASKGAAKVAAKKVATKAAKTAVAKSAVKGAARSAARTGAERAVQLLPAGDEQLQFEITAVFALAVAEIHDMSLDQEQAHALVYGLSNGRVSQQQIAAMATDVAHKEGATASVGQTIASGRNDWSHWANTLADTLPGGAAQDLVRTVQTGQLETARTALNGKQQSVIEYGVGALAGGATRFLFGGEVVEAARVAFADAPEEFPEHLSDALLAKADEEHEPNRALVALEEGAKTTGAWVSNAADRSTRVFRSVDLDGDGIADEPQALSAAKAVGGVMTGAMSTGTRAFRSVDRDGDGIPDEPQALSALKGAGTGVASRLRRKKAAEDLAASDPEDERVEGRTDD
ncbi:hypothetical protein [Nocardioides sp.]|uniref:hypothetical protein n=1 Tax=Nocardioides sp. TaxID=35761 RepID=UPI00260C3339|nr:hypothetical protein [Nocardioides sp.]MCW2736046.1 hypothetical protein [Nocardioides sp.]